MEMADIFLSVAAIVWLISIQEEECHGGHA